jgi:serine/threonine protein kinase
VGVILHILLIGTPPFYHDNNVKLLKMIKTSTQISFENRLWRTRSIGCIDLVKKLMDCNFTLRASAEVSIDHEWLRRFSHFHVEKSAIRQCLVNFKEFRNIGPLQRAFLVYMVTKLFNDHDKDFMKKIFYAINRA